MFYIHKLYLHNLLSVALHFAVWLVFRKSGQASPLLHSVVWFSLPMSEQSLPYRPGRGFVQKRFLARCPIPQVTEHWVQVLQSE